MYIFGGFFMKNYFFAFITLLILFPFTGSSINPQEGHLYKLFKNSEKKSNLKMLFVHGKYYKDNRQIRMLEKAVDERMDSSVTEYHTGDNFIPVYKNVFGYNENGKITLLMEYEKDEFMNYVPSYKMEYFYDENGNNEKIINYSSETGTLEFEYQIDFTINDDGKPESAVFSQKNENEEIVPSETMLFEYDENGNIERETYDFYIEQMEQWVTYMITEYFYESNLLVETYTYLLSELTLELEPYSSDNIYYDENNNVSYNEGYLYSADAQEFFLLNATEYTYDDFFNPLSETMYFMDFENGELAENYLYDFEYDFNSNADDIIMSYIVLQPEYSEQTVHKPAQYTEWRMNGNWELEYRTVYYYSNDGTSVKENDFPVSVYPNPAKDVINFYLSENIIEAELIIYDILGNNVLGTYLSGKFNLNISDFPSGIYYYSLKNKNSIIRGNFVKL